MSIIDPQRSRAVTPSTALFTDHYELTMLDALIAAGRADNRAVFEVFTRRLPAGRAYGVLAGTGPLLGEIEEFRFGDDELAHLEANGVVSASTIEWLADYRFRGSVLGYREGEVYFPHSPVLTIDAPLGEALILETIVLSGLNFPSAVAAAATRIARAAQGHLVMEAGSRRIEAEAAVAAARAAYIGGVDVSSNLEAGRRYGIPTAGTAAHAFTLAFPSERAAFEAQLAALGADSTFLVDTHHIPTAIRTAVDVTGGRLKAIRIDSGDLWAEAVAARALLDELGAHHTQIMLSGDLDEYRIAELVDSPADAFESGHRLVTGSGAPSAGFVYKLVAVADTAHPDAPLRPVQKDSDGKQSYGGQKAARRRLDRVGRAQEELVVMRSDAATEPMSETDRLLQVPLMIDGERVDHTDAHAARRHCRNALEEITPEHRTGDHSGPAIPTTVRLAGAEERVW